MAQKWKRNPQLDEALAHLAPTPAGPGVFLTSPLFVAETPDGIRTAFTIVGGPVNGVHPTLDRAQVVDPTDYTLTSGNTQMTFTSPVPVGSVIGGLMW